MIWLSRLYKLSQSSFWAVVYDDMRVAGGCVAAQWSIREVCPSMLKTQCCVPDNLSPFYKRTVKTATRQQQPTLQCRARQTCSHTTTYNYNHTTYNNLHYTFKPPFCARLSLIVGGCKLQMVLIIIMIREAIELNKKAPKYFLCWLHIYYLVGHRIRSSRWPQNTLNLREN